jgi:crossover junction endodeoxyribonuclease RusA
MSKQRTYQLPWPPSINHYWKTSRNGGRHISKAGVAFREEVCFDLRGVQTTLTGRLAVHIEAMPPDRRVRDLDNLLKPTLDALEHARVYENDNQIDQLRIDRLPVHKPGRLDITIVEL